MAAFARMVVLLLVAVLGLSPWSGTRELRRAAPSEGVQQQASRPDGHSIAINRSEKSRGVHQQRVAAGGFDPASASDDDELALVDRACPTTNDAIGVGVDVAQEPRGYV